MEIVQRNRAEWLDHPLAKARLERLRGGRSFEDWLTDRYLRDMRVSRALSIGAGIAMNELELVRLGAVERFDLYDVSQVALNAAMERAHALGIADRIHIHREDINQVTLPPDTYDLVTFFSALHHMSDLEGILRQVNTTLTPQGLLFASEYVGPDRFAFPEQDATLAKQLYRVLDPALKAPWPELPQPDPRDVARADPTESIHSADIVAAIQRGFDQVEIIPLGHALTFILWWGLNHDALYETQRGLELVQVILDLDSALVNSGQLPSYFSYITARKRRGAIV